MGRLLGEACFNSPEWGGGSSPVKTETPLIVLLLLLFLLLLLTQIDETAMPLSTQPYDQIGTNPVPSHLGVNSRRLQHHRPSSTHNCECSRAPKKSTRAKVRTQIKLKTQEVVEIMHRFPRTANEQPEHRQSAQENRPQESSPPIT